MEKGGGRELSPYTNTPKTSAVKSTATKAASMKGKDDSSAKMKRSKGVQIDSEDSCDDELDFAPKSGNLSKGGNGDKVAKGRKTPVVKETARHELKTVSDLLGKMQSKDEEQSLAKRMNTSADTWQILHIPDKPQFPPNQQPTVSVLVSAIEPKLANIIIRHLNLLHPLEDFRHLKRIRKQYVEGRIQLSVILCLAFEDEYQFNSLPKDIQELIISYQLSPFITKVCKYAAASREEWEEQSKLWPTSYHPPTYNIAGITGFSEEESQSVFKFMKVAIDLAKSSDGLIINAAVIVDPLVQRTIAYGCDQTGLWQTCTDDKEASHVTVLMNDSYDKPERSCIGASCLNPWQWQQLHTISFCHWNPLRHAAIVAIEFSADRDRRMFPGSGRSGEGPTIDGHEHSPLSSSVKRQKTSLETIDNEKEVDAHAEVSHSAPARPYLCTGYDIYLVWEPCAMCSMALVHQRIRRIFYAFPNASAGALGSVHRLQGEKSLNHHYAVFRACLPEEVLRYG